jgi:hypothetical protein
MYNTSTLSINDLELLILNLKSDVETRGGGGPEIYSCKKLDESSQSENIHKRPLPANPRLAKALNWCHRRKLERDNLRVTNQSRK